MNPPPKQPELDAWLDQGAQKAQTLRAIGRQVFGFKPFYINRMAFEANRHALMVLGINPGGGAEGERAEQAQGYLTRILDPQGGPFCSITPGKNGEPGSEKQRYAVRVRAYLASVLGWEQTSALDPKYPLIPLGNINPFRAPTAATMEDDAWAAGVGLGLELIASSQPKLLLLIGTGGGRSTWGALRNHLLLKPGLADMASGPWSGQPAAPEVSGAKQALLTWHDTGAVTQVLALPHPKVPITTQAYEQQRVALRRGFSAWKGLALADPYQPTSNVLLT